MGAVYTILHKKTKKPYVGSTIHLKSRINQHFSDLRKGRHSNIHLQQAFTKYGEDQFEWKVLEEVNDSDMLRVREEHWMEELGACVSGYNIAKDATAPMTGRKNPNARAFGKGEQHERSVLTEERVRKIFDLAQEGLNQKQIASQVGCHFTNVSMVLRGKTWTHLGLKRPDGRYNNKSGCVGVYKAKTKWKAEIINNGKYYGLGYYNTKEQAIEARKAAEVQLGV